MAGESQKSIRALAAQGFGIDLDDFGTGHASISNIRRFHVSRIKIDRSFVADIDKSSEQQLIAAAIINMADSLKIGVIAEGVETPAEHSILAQLGCQAAQGFLFGKPMPLETTIPWINAYSKDLWTPPPLSRKAG